MNPNFYSLSVIGLLLAVTIYMILLILTTVPKFQLGDDVKYIKYCDHHIRIRTGSYHQKTIEVGTESLRNFSDCKRNAVRENPAIAGAYRYRGARTKYFN